MFLLIVIWNSTKNIWVFQGLPNYLLYSKQFAPYFIWHYDGYYSIIKKYNLEITWDLWTKECVQ